MIDFSNFGKSNRMKEIDLLEEHIAKLESKEFDFKVWKQYSIMLLSRIFGETEQRVKQISMLDIDYSSWSLRDATGRSSKIDTLKKLGKEILQSAIDELKSFGLPKNSEINPDLILKEIILALESELKISQLKELNSMINGDLNPDLKKSEIAKKLAGYGEQAIINILATLLSSNNLKGKV
jgi:hypothetical protein